MHRLLRNRVSAQQARERKKSYVQNLEQKARDQEQSITEMEQRIIKLERENVMLRSVRRSAATMISCGPNLAQMLDRLVFVPHRRLSAMWEHQVIKNMQQPMTAAGPAGSYGGMPGNSYNMMQQTAPAYGIPQPAYGGF